MEMYLKFIIFSSLNTEGKNNIFYTKKKAPKE